MDIGWGFFGVCCLGYLNLYKGLVQKKFSYPPITPNLVQTYKGNIPISLDITEDQFRYIPSLPFLNIVNKNINEDYPTNIASFLGFTLAPTVISDPIDGLTYFWKNDNSTFFAYTKSSKIRYSSGRSLVVQNKQLSESVVKAIVNKFITDSGITKTDSFSLGDVQYLKEGSLNEGFIKTTSNDFSIFQINILPKSTEYEIISPTSTENTNYIQLTKDGEVYSFQFVVFDDIQKGVTEYSLKNFKEINNSVSDSVLISLGGEETPMQELPTNYIKSVVIDQIDIAYLLDSALSTNIQPVYKLTGTATISNTSKVQAILYLPALKGL